MSGKRSHEITFYECTLCKAHFEVDQDAEENGDNSQLEELPAFSAYYYCTPECYLGVRRRTEKGRDYERIKARLEEILRRTVNPRHTEFRVTPQSETTCNKDKRIRVSLSENVDMELDQESDDAEVD